MLRLRRLNRGGRRPRRRPQDGSTSVLDLESDWRNNIRPILFVSTATAHLFRLLIRSELTLQQQKPGGKTLRKSLQYYPVHPRNFRRHSDPVHVEHILN